MTKTSIPAADLKAGDKTVGYEVLSTRPATAKEVADLWADGPHPALVIAARVRWTDGGESDRFWASTQPVEVIRD